MSNTPLRLATLCATLLTTTWATEAAAATPPALQAIGPIRVASNPDKCVDVSSGPNSGIADGTNVHLWDCFGGENQAWYMTMTGEVRSAKDPSKCLRMGPNLNVEMATCNFDILSQTWKLTAEGELQLAYFDELCLDLQSGGMTNATNLQIYACNGTPAQQFVTTRIPWAPVHSALHSDRCLDVSGAGTSNGTNVISWECHGDDNQAWYLNAQGELRSAVAANRCLDVGGFYSGANTQLWTCNGTDAQRFLLGQDGQLHLDAHPNLCVDVSGGSSALGANVQLYSCNGTPAQRWSSTSFMGVEIAEIDGGIALIWNQQSGGYALTDPVVILQMLHRMGADSSAIGSTVDAFSSAQSDYLIDALADFDDLEALVAANPVSPLLHAVDQLNGDWAFNASENGFNSSLWGVNAGVSVDDDFAVLHLSGGGAQISAGAGIVDVSSMFSADLRGSFDLGGGPIGFTLQLGIFQVDLYVTGIDIAGTYEDVVDFGEDAIAWGDEAGSDIEGWVDGAASDSANWVGGAVDTVGGAVEDVFDAISDIF